MIFNARSGSVKTNRLDDAELNKEKQKFEKFQNFYRNVLMNVSVSIKTLEELTEQTDDVFTFKKYCPAFHNSVIHNFWAQSVIELNECFKGKYSFNKALDFIKANWNKIYTGKWEEVTNWDDNTVEREEIVFDRDKIFQQIKEVEQILDLEENKQIINKIKEFRDKSFAHIDEDFPKTSIYLADLRKAFVFAEKVFNILFSMYDNIHRFLEPTNSDDVSNLINVVETYDKHQEQIIELDVNEKYER